MYVIISTTPSFVYGRIASICRSVVVIEVEDRSIVISVLKQKKIDEYFFLSRRNFRHFQRQIQTQKLLLQKLLHNNQN